MRRRALPMAARPIGDIVVTPRSLSDYRDLFLLGDGDLLGGPILDCPGGASPFGAQVRARGGTVVNVDPEYHRPLDELVERVRADLERTAAWMDANPGNFDRSYLGSPRAVTRAFELAAELFAGDYAPDGRRYVAAGLPELPFADRRFPAHPQQPPAVQLPRAARLRRARRRARRGRVRRR
jgi:hypothetical protein